jgi:hypothetical protein
MTTRVIMESGLIINPADSSCASLWGLRIGLGSYHRPMSVPRYCRRSWRVPPNGKRRNTLRLDRRDRGASPVSRPTGRRRTRAVSLPLSGCSPARAGEDAAPSVRIPC